MGFDNDGELIGFSLFMLAALILLVLGFLRKRKTRKWSYVEGVYDTESKLGLGKPKPTVRYTVNGTEFKTTSSLGQNYVPRNGKRVGVYYHPKNPGKIIIDSFIQRGDLFIVLGLLFLGTGLLFFV